MRICRRAALAGAALVCCGAPASAQAVAPLRLSKPPVVVVAGGKLTLTIVVAPPRKAAKSLRVRLVLSPTRRAAAGIEIGAKTVHAVRAHRSRRVRVATTTPAAVPWPTAFLLGCVRIGKAAERCAAPRKVAVSETGGASAKIDAALAAHLISASRAVHLLATSLHGGRLPVAYRSANGVPDEGADRRFIALWSAVGAADHAFMVPYLLPPDTVGSAWARRQGRAAAAAAPAGRDAAAACAEHAKLDARGWATAPAAGGNVLLHFDDALSKSQVATMTAAVAKIAKAYADSGFRTPVGDGAITCAHGGSAAFDVYITPEWTAGGGAMTISYPRTDDDPCFAKPGPRFIIANPSVAGVGLAHEYFHAIQAAYGYAKGCPNDDPFGWLDESTAVWAEHLVYPGNHFTLVERQLHAVRDRAGLIATYSGWLFWYATARLHGGPAVVHKAMVALEAAHATTLKTGVKALDGSVPGGLRTRLDDYAAIAWNHAPVGTSGFPVADTFARWKIDEERPAQPAKAQQLALGGLHLKTIKLDAGALSSGKAFGMAFGRRRYADVDITDPKIAEVRWKNAFIGRPGVDVQAYLHLADGTWRREDWSARATVTLCRKHAAENVDEILLTTTNADVAGLRSLPDGAVDELRARDLCSFPPTFTGTWTRTITEAARGYTETINGTATFHRNAILPPIADEIIQVPYDLVSGSVRWTVTGGTTVGSCTTTYLGSGTDTVDQPDALSNTFFGLEDVSPRITVPEPRPYYYAIVATGGRLAPPQYTITPGPGCAQPVTHEDIVVFYLDIGVNGDFTSLAPDQIPRIEKSASAGLLAGSRTHAPDFFPPFVVTDSWRFVGSG